MTPRRLADAQVRLAAGRATLCVRCPRRITCRSNAPGSHRLPAAGGARRARPTCRFRSAANGCRADSIRPLPPLDEWPLSRIAGHVDARRPAPPRHAPQSVAPLKPQRIDRSSSRIWALLRRQQSRDRRIAVRSPAAATLGASQAGARLTYNFTRQIAATLRTSSDVGRRGGEFAAGRARPADRQHSGVAHRRTPAAHRPIRRRPQRLRLVRRRRRLPAADAVALQPRRLSARRRRRRAQPRPVHRRRAHPDPAGVQAILRRLRRVGRRPAGSVPGRRRPAGDDAVRNNFRVHFDWRQRLAGNAQPGSGPAVTLAGDF